MWGMSGNMGGGENKMSQFSCPIDSKQTLVFTKNLQTDIVLVRKGWVRSSCAPGGENFF